MTGQCAGIQRILADELLPTLRSVIADLGGDTAGTLVHSRPTSSDSRWPSNSVAALVHHLCGVLTSWGAACLGGEDVDAARGSGTLTIDWVLAHILHDVAQHVGHLELTRDVLLSPAVER